METIYVQTHGCSANVVDSESMMGLLVESGFKLADEIEYSDIIILNICTVKGSHVALKEIKNITEHFPEKKLIIAGCITKPLVASIRKISQEAALVNTHNIHRIVEIVEELLHGNIMEALTIENTIKSDLPGIRTNNVIGIVPIASGCSDRCTYCSVKLIKGNIFSYPESSIINAVKKNVKDGCKEIWITSQDSGAYGLDNGKRGLPKLLDKILEEVQGNYKIRLGMIDRKSVV